MRHFKRACGASAQTNVQTVSRINNILGNKNLRRSTICATSSTIGSCRTISSFQVSINNACLFLRTSTHTKVNGNRNSPCKLILDFVNNIGGRSSTCSIAILRTHNRCSATSRKHRHCAHGNRQRGCEEQGGCFLRQFHSPCSAMGPAADGQPWICLLLSHRMVC